MHIPYSKYTCLFIIQVWTTYAVIMGTIGLFVALTQVDFLLIRLVADLIVNHVTTAYFLRSKVVDPERYHLWENSQKQVRDDNDDNISAHMPGVDGDVELCSVCHGDHTALLKKAEAQPPSFSHSDLF